MSRLQPLWVSVEGIEGALARLTCAGSRLARPGASCLLVDEISDHGRDTQEGAGRRGPARPR